MRPTVDRTAVLVLFLTLAFTGCAEDSNLTDVTDAPATTFFRRAPAPGFDALQRATPLNQEISVSRIVGPQGGLLELKEAGVTFRVPAGALTEPVEITMTALAGHAMAFDFAPHGLEFLTPASISVRVGGTTVDGLLDLEGRDPEDGTRLDRFLGVYFEGEPEEGVEPLENLETYWDEGSVAFDIMHFSGYVCATG